MIPRVLSVPALLLLGSCAFCAGAADAVSADDFNTESATAAQVLQNWYSNHGLWDSTGWWNAAHCVEALEDVLAIDDARQYLPVLRNTFDLNSKSNFLNQYYDDEGWWANAWIRAGDLTGDPAYLKMARTIFEDMTKGWDDHCGGGIWWSKERGYKNAIANELFFLVAVRLHQRIPGDAGAGSCYDWAEREWHWFEQSGMLNSQNLVNDGLTFDCVNNGRTTWSYNQGVLIGALVEWHKVTGDTRCLAQAEAIADAVLRNLVTTNGVLREVREPRRGTGSHDVPQFKGILVRHLASLYDFSRKPAYLNFLLANARSIWANDRNDRNQLGFRWNGPFDTADAARQSSALAALCAVATPITEVRLDAPRTWIAASLAHNIGCADPFNCWEADPLRDKTSGFLIKGPVPAELPAGDYTAQFELKVDNFNWDNTGIATLSIVDCATDKPITTRELTRGQFTNTLFHAISLPFHAAVGARYEFRVLWHYAPHAPRLTLRTLAVNPN
jgi:predicted alpha-1,6-mannanase (GH76 family)